MKPRFVSRGTRAYDALVAAAAATPGALASFRTDLTTHDRAFTISADGAPFAWAVCARGTHLCGLVSHERHAVHAARSFLSAVAESFDVLGWYVWDGAGLVPCANAGEAADRLEHATAKAAVAA